MNNRIADVLNLWSLLLQLENADSLKLDQISQHLEDKLDNEINQKLDIILRKLEKIEHMLGY